LKVTKLPSATAERGERRSRRSTWRGLAVLAAAGVLATVGADAQAKDMSGHSARVARAGVSVAPATPVTVNARTASVTASQAIATVAAAFAQSTAAAKTPKGFIGPNAAGLCPTNLGRIACVDLTHQRMWVQVGSKVVFGPVQVRTGRAGFVTRTGLWHIYWRDQNHYSSIYHVAMPYSQFFSGGEAFHGLDEPMSTPPGSHGCVNMNTWDARTLWGILKLNDPVMIFGQKSGT
jgi:lipoprotein-anchoring transpeptidase ErfK/SrfK